MRTQTTDSPDRHTDRDAYQQRLADELAAELTSPDTSW